MSGDKIYYTGIGSRETPDIILEKMKKIAFFLGEIDCVLRSGGANGADSAFEKGCVNFYKEIYLPWKNFNNNTSELYSVSAEAMELAKTIHSSWDKLSEGAKKLHGRNCYQVLGKDLKTPSKVLICWTKEGKETGGTRTAIVLARNNKIPVINLANEELSKTKLRQILNIQKT